MMLKGEVNYWENSWGTWDLDTKFASLCEMKANQSLNGQSDSSDPDTDRPDFITSQNEWSDLSNGINSMRNQL